MPAPILYAIERAHLDLLKAIAERLRFIEDDDNTSRDAAIGIMSVVRYAEALQALRGPGELYVHLYPKDDIYEPFYECSQHGRSPERCCQKATKPEKP